MENSDRVCAICQGRCEDGDSSISQLRAKGCETINRMSKERGDNIDALPGQYVHKSCRRDYTNPKSNAKPKPETVDQRQPPLKCQVQCLFDFKSDCFYCGNTVDTKRHDVFEVVTLETKEKVLSVCAERNDHWSELVKARILNVHDLPAAEATYHQSCSVNFRTNKQIPKQFASSQIEHKKRKSGRPEEDEKREAFLKVTRFLKENDDEQITVVDLETKMNEYLGGSGAYTRRYLKTKLEEHFGNEVLITTVNTKPNVVTLRKTAKHILQEFHEKQQNVVDPETEAENIVRAAAKLIKSDIKLVETRTDEYPLIATEPDAHTDILPPTLKLFLESILAGNDKIKVAALGQAIMQAARPKVFIAPLQIGLGVQMHHNFASRFLIDILHRLGFCSSYREVQTFNESAAVDQGPAIPNYNAEFVQYAADNVDHDIRTLDGRNTFHGMGMIAAVTPGTSLDRNVPRQRVSTEDILAAGQVEIVPAKEPLPPLLHIKYNQLAVKAVTDPTANLDVLWKSSLLFGKARPAWSGLMQSVQTGDYPGKSSVHFLPMIDMSPSDLTCINTTLTYVARHALANGASPIITFDQPLWWKAYNLIESEPPDSILRQIVLRLGGFHTLMSYLGSISQLMAGSGLRELMEMVYACNAVDHIMSGKAVARAVRAHLLVDAALNTLLYSKALDEPIPQLTTDLKGVPETSTQQESAEQDPGLDPVISSETPIALEAVTSPQPEQATGSTLSAKHGATSRKEQMSTTTNRGELQERSSDDVTHGSKADADNEAISLKNEAAQLMDDLRAKTKSPEEVNAAEALNKIMREVMLLKDRLKEESRTAALWIQYMEMTDILRSFIKAERTANWQLHLQAVSQMLPYLAASGHNHYTKCAWLYLQSMARLESEHPQLYQEFTSGYHVVRRSDRYWAGLSTDLVIEQVLMRSLKTSGGLTRGRGMTERQRLTWLLSRPACAETSNALQELTGVIYNSGEQNKDVSKTRIGRDMADTTTILDVLSDRNPFASTPATLRNIMNGVNAEEAVNVDTAKAIGETIMQSMTGRSVMEYTFQRSSKAVTLGATSSVRIDNEQVQVDPQLLFQRLVLACSTSGDMEEVFQYELCTYPASLFEAPGLMRPANKPALADALWSMAGGQDDPQTGETQYVLDGGALLHRCSWPTPGSATYDELCEIYCRHVKRKYGRAIVVFDGYENLTTKSMTQQRRAANKTGSTVTFTSHMKATMKKEAFLANSKNKQRFIEMLRKKLDENGCVTLQANGDADVLIVKTAVETSQAKHTTLVGDDTDLIVLLLYYYDVAMKDLIFKPEAKRNAKQQRVWMVKNVKTQLGNELCSNLLFIHAILGCDTTSRVYGIGKGAALKKFVECPHFREQASVFHRADASPGDIIEAGEMALVSLLNGRKGEKLDHLRYRKYYEKLVNRKAQVQPQTLPPTSAAAEKHSLRVYLQVKQWKGEDGNPTEAQKWGWSVRQEQLRPIMTDRPAAPDALLRIIRCNCSSDCSSRRCTCRKNGLECSPACGQCKGISCTNSPADDADVEEDDDSTN